MLFRGEVHNSSTERVWGKFQKIRLELCLRSYYGEKRRAFQAERMAWAKGTFQKPSGNPYWQHPARPHPSYFLELRPLALPDKVS